MFNDLARVLVFAVVCAFSSTALADYPATITTYKGDGTAVIWAKSGEVWYTATIDGNDWKIEQFDSGGFGLQWLINIWDTTELAWLEVGGMDFNDPDLGWDLETNAASLEAIIDLFFEDPTGGGGCSETPPESFCVNTMTGGILEFTWGDGIDGMGFYAGSYRIVQYAHGGGDWGYIFPGTTSDAGWVDGLPWCEDSTWDNPANHAVDCEGGGDPSHPDFCITDGETELNFEWGVFSYTSGENVISWDEEIETWMFEGVMGSGTTTADVWSDESWLPEGWTFCETGGGHCCGCNCSSCCDQMVSRLDTANTYLSDIKESIEDLSDDDSGSSSPPTQPDLEWSNSTVFSFDNQFPTELTSQPISIAVPFWIGASEGEKLTISTAIDGPQLGEHGIGAWLSLLSRTIMTFGLVCHYLRRVWDDLQSL